MNRIYFFLQIFVISILSEKLKSVSSYYEVDVNKGITKERMKQLIEYYDEIRTTNPGSFKAYTFHPDCKVPDSGSRHCIVFAEWGKTNKKYRCLTPSNEYRDCFMRAPKKNVADPKRWKPALGCSPLFIFRNKYHKGCAIYEDKKMNNRPWCSEDIDYDNIWNKTLHVQMTKPCKYMRVWADWFTWTRCSKSCNGIRHRDRYCNAGGDYYCEGEKYETGKCNECPNIGGQSTQIGFSKCIFFIIGSIGVLFVI